MIFSNFGLSEFLSVSLSLSILYFTHLWHVKLFKSHFSIDLNPWILLVSCLHAHMISFNLLQEKNTYSEYILKKTYKLSYLVIYM